MRSVDTGLNSVKKRPYRGHMQMSAEWLCESLARQVSSTGIRDKAKAAITSVAHSSSVNAHTSKMEGIGNHRSLLPRCAAASSIQGSAQIAELEMLRTA